MIGKVKEKMIDIDGKYKILFTDSIVKSIEEETKEKYNKYYIFFDTNIKSNNEFEDIKNKYENKDNFIFIEKNICENTKNLETYQEIIFEMVKLNIMKSDLIITIGGGVLLDTVSFCAATLNRGVSHLNVPTTLLSMVDASIGSKCGVNVEKKKNAVGIFSDPVAVLINIEFLNTLDKRQINNGISEIIKAALLADDTIMEDLMATDIDIEKVIYKSNMVKRLYVNKDPFDKGVRQHLNFGHTYGHAIESYYGYEKYLHGEAVAIGMCVASNNDARLISALLNYNLPYQIDQDVDLQKLIEIMHMDKKNVSNKTEIIELKDTGATVVSKADEEIKKALSNNVNLKIKKVRVNASKSILHRTLINALIVKGKYQIKIDKNDFSEDIKTTIGVLENCNIKIEYLDGYIAVDSRNIKDLNKIFQMNDSGTTARMMIPILVQLFGTIKIDMSDQLKKRPFGEFIGRYDISDSYPKVYTKKKTQDKIEINVRGDISSQYISGYIYVAVLKGQETKIKISGKVNSKNYILLTIKTLSQIGANIEYDNESNIITIKPSILAIEKKIFDPEIDYSNYAFFQTCNKLWEINGVNKRYIFENKLSVSTQSDYIINEILDKQIEKVDMSNCPDLLPILMVYGALNKKGITLYNITRIRFKESDRVQVMIDNFAEIGVKVKLRENEISVLPVTNIKAAEIATHSDHRIAMAFEVFSKVTNCEFEYDNLECVKKSFVDFWNQISWEK